MRYEIRIRAGVLRIATHHERLPLDEILDFASRQNPKRGFLFVSKVLGKHIPCRPARMREVYDRLAEPLATLPGPVVVIGMAETATGLGGGVADSLAQCTGRDDVLYLHTTRHHLDVPLLLRFDESHSHAPDHILYVPRQTNRDLFEQARSLVLVDDEISTGRTLRLLAERVATNMPQLQCTKLVAIVNWLDADRQRALVMELAHHTDFVSLLEGSFTFHADPDFRPSLPPGMVASRPSRHARADTGRTGLRVPVTADALPLPFAGIPTDPLVMVGTGEFSFVPFLVAERLEQQGYDVLFQSTTRSPIMEGEAIRRKLAFTDEHGEDIANYIYNLPADRRIIVAYEHPDMAAAHDLPTRVGAEVWALPIE